jgi:hypothetical protein
MLVRCNHTGKSPGCTSCPHGKPHGLELDAPPPGTTKISAWCSEVKKNVECTRVSAQPKEEETMNTETKAPVNESPAYQPPQIDMIPVESSMLEGIGHDGAETLRVWYKKGSPYDHVGITEEKFFDVVNAASVGKALNAMLKECGIKGIKLTI